MRVYWGWPWGMHGPGLLGGLLALLFLAAFVGLVVWLIVTLARSTRSKPALPASPSAASGSAQPDPVLDILRRRLAEGQITAAEFDELREKLGV